MVRLILFPLTAKQAKSMIAMQRAQPEIKKLQAKYKNDKQKLNEELMKFYKENSINPLGGCLPLIAQMPVFIALYQTLNEIQNFIPEKSRRCTRTSARRGATTCTVVSLDFFGMNLTQSAARRPKGFANALPYYVLVGLVVVTAFLQQRQTMRNQTQVNPQMQIIGKVMPVVFGFISISIPAGVVLYFFTSNLWQLGQQEVVYRTIGTAAGPPPKKGDKGGGGGGKGPDPGGGKGSPAIEAKSTETTPPATGGVKGLFKSLSPSSAAAADEAPSGNGTPEPKSTGSKNTGAKSAGSKSTGAKSAPAKKSTTAAKKPASGGGPSANTARRKNNRKRKR